MLSCLDRMILTLLMCTACVCTCLAEETVGEKAEPPFNVLFSNDTTNLITCVSPYHTRGQDFTEDMVRCSVDETAGTGVDVHMLQPGTTWVPFWQSRVYSMQEHFAWFESRYGRKPHHPFNDYLLNGGDIVQAFVARCHQHGMAPFVSLRMNDAHCLESRDGDNLKGGALHALSKFYVENAPAYCIGPNRNEWNQRVQNWAIPAVRDYKLRLIEEVCENYDIAGLELDFQRFPNYFRLHETDAAQRHRIMRQFIQRVRGMLDRTSAPGQCRWLCVRIPNHMDVFDKLGIDLPQWAQAGVDLFNVSGYYFTDQQGDLREIAAQVPDSAKYVELTHCSGIGRTVGSGYDNFAFRRTTDEQFYTLAHLAYAAGFDGVSAFNFVYYREHGTQGRGQFREPPFHVFEHIGDKEWVSRRKQHYYVGKFWNDPRRPYRPMPRRLEKNQANVFFVQMAAPKGGWTQDARLRIQSDELWGKQTVAVVFNSIPLESCGDVTEPYPHPYESGIGVPEQYRAFTIPVHLLAQGLNQIEVILRKGDPISIIYLDIAAE